MTDVDVGLLFEDQQWISLKLQKLEGRVKELEASNKTLEDRIKELEDRIEKSKSPRWGYEGE